MKNQFPFHQESVCTEVQDTLEAYLANDLDAAAHAITTAHVASCPRCQDEVRFAQAILKALQELPRPEPSSKIFNAVSAHIQAEPQSNRWQQLTFELIDTAVSELSEPEPPLDSFRAADHVRTHIYGDTWQQLTFQFT